MNAPQRIERDTYTGRHTVWGPGKSYRVTMWGAAELARLAPEGAIFESFGHVRGKEGFSRTRYVADTAGNLHCYDSEGTKKIIHPADRKLRILTR